MPRQIDYPRASLSNAIRLADAVHDLGGQCSVELAADKLGKKVSGAFQALVGATMKYGLVAHKKGQLSTTKLYREFKLAYTKEESNQFAQKAFLSVPLFRTIFERFVDKKLPVSHFEKLLIRELSVPDAIASRVAKYFVDGAKQIGLMKADNLLVTEGGSGQDEIQEIQDDDNIPNEGEDDVEQMNPRQKVLGSTYSIRIKGPGIDSQMAINESEDLYIVQAMLKKIEKKLQEQGEEDQK
ncbi:MAG: hypothetical protein ACREHG_08280 [Candidatus Saccharimonadales bacterium]